MLIGDGVAQLGPGAAMAHSACCQCNRALLRRRLLDAAAAGSHTIFVELGGGALERYAAAYSLLLDAGFEEAYESKVWRRPALRPAAVEYYY